MIPRWHIILGALFTLFIWTFAPSINPVYLGLIFASSFLVDFDHYVVAALKQNKVRLKHALNYHKEMRKTEFKEKKQGIRRKGDFHLFHTVEFQSAIGLLGILWVPFYYIFIGMFFHSMIDLGDLLRKDRFYRREFFLTNWLRKKMP